ncbi:hypothetical protein [Lacticaseibacillus paracasei]|uniref:hypothetical protein n=1 Tax=Lacticaseibacillus paracasei TaxID=1597 RepID=UPI000FF4EC12|nr:hypothetical protein [Lacticaseibacillus paracasei]RND76021.1 hypothetical protein FAM18149_02351 [Lacticaseibacillus paracasei]RND84230.1 hypothetical protein FAM18168_01419 [Lacticaseibacillus paracasei]
MDGKLVYLTDKNEYIFITTMGLNNEIKDAMETDMSQRLNAKVAVISNCGAFEYISKKEMVPKIEGVELPDHAGFSEPFIEDQDKALKDFQQKLEQSSQHASTPHVRIEFDDINDVPHVWIDGKYISSFPDHGLVRLNLEWNADKGHIKPKHYYIEYLNGEDTSPYQYTGIGQTNETDE